MVPVLGALEWPPFSKASVAIQVQVAPVWMPALSSQLVLPLSGSVEWVRLAPKLVVDVALTARGLTLASTRAANRALNPIRRR